MTLTCAFKLFRREVFERVPLASVRSNGAFFSAELLITLKRVRRSGPARSALAPSPRTAGKQRASNRK